MHGEVDLNVLLRTMEPVLHSSTFVFHSSALSFADALAYDPILLFKENEGTALILKKEKADDEGLNYHYVSRMITLNVHSSLEAVGFLAAITAHLAKAGISVNPVSAHFHDHLFVPEERANDAMHILNNIKQE